MSYYRRGEADITSSLGKRGMSFAGIFCKIGGNMKKRILSFALVLMFCFSLIGTVDLHDEHSHVHAGQYTTLSIFDWTDTSITVYAPTSDYYITVTGPNDYNESTSASSGNVDIGTSNITFKGMAPETVYTLTLFKTDDTQVEQKTQKTKASAPATPSAPTVKGYGSTNITLDTVSTQEYSLDGGTTWQPASSGNTTTFYYENQALPADRVSIKPGTSYSIVTRVKETTTTMPSDKSDPLPLTTVHVPTVVNFATVDSSSFTISAVAGVEYSLDGNTYQTSGRFTGIVPGQAYTIYARYAANAAENSAAGDVYRQTITLPSCTGPVIENTIGTNGELDLSFTIKPGTFTVSDIKYSGTLGYTNNGATVSVPFSEETHQSLVSGNGSLGYTITIKNIPASALNLKYSLKWSATVLGADYTLFEATDAPLAHTHSYAPATCTEPATCSCGATNGKPLGHIDADGNGICDRCNTTFCQHVWSPANPTCEQSKTCTKCGIVIAATGHTWTPATCTSPKTCSVCGAKEGAALGHSTTQVNGTKYYYCSRCGRTDLIAHDSTNYNGDHATCPYCTSFNCTNPNCRLYKGCDGTAAGCKGGNASGKIPHTAGHAVCSSCGGCLLADCEKYKGCTTSKCADNPYGGTEDHKPGNILHQTCPKCGSCTYSICKNYRGCDGTATGCKNQGGTGSNHLSTHQTCSICGSCLVTSCPLYKGCTVTTCNNKPDQSTCAHTWVAVKYEVYPCSEEAKTVWGGYGSGTFKCSKCGKEETKAVPASNHTYGKREQLSIGTWVQKCTMCGDLKICEDQSCGHNFTMYFRLEITSATDCTVGGTWTYKCTYPGCGYIMKKTVAAGSHAFNSGVVTTAPTQTTPGVKTYTCMVCNKTKTESIPALGGACVNGHTYGAWITTTKATCTTAGEQTRTCSVCNDIQTQTIPATGHSYGNYVTLKNSTCKEAGYKERTCSVCGKEDRVTLPLADHDMVLVSSNEATCISDGVTIKECSVCKIRDEKTTPATGVHSFVDDGDNAKKCVVCGFRYETVIDGNKKQMKFEENGVALTVTGSTADKYFYQVTEKKTEDYDWLDSWMTFLKDKGDVTSDAALLTAYLVEVTNDGNKVSIGKEMTATISIPEENKKTAVKLYTVKGNAPVEITELKRDGNTITVSGESLEDSTGDFFVISLKSAKKSNPAVAIVIGIVSVVAIAGVGGFFLYKKGFFTSGD